MKEEEERRKELEEKLAAEENDRLGEEEVWELNKLRNNLNTGTVLTRRSARVSTRD